MGIDIRDGAQLECINCGLCIDACDEIMLKVERPVQLIAYDTDAAVDARGRGAKPAYPLIRPRTVLYAVLLIGLSGLMLWGISHRPLVVMDVLRDRNPTFVRLHDGSVRDGYTLKIANRGFERRDFIISAGGLNGLSLKTPGAPSSAQGVWVSVEANEVRSVRVLVTLPAGPTAEVSSPILFTAQNPSMTVSVRSTFQARDPHAPS
jgi:polyferredoxin